MISSNKLGTREKNENDEQMLWHLTDDFYRVIGAEVTRIYDTKLQKNGKDAELKYSGRIISLDEKLEISDRQLYVEEFATTPWHNGDETSTLCWELSSLYQSNNMPIPIRLTGWGALVAVLSSASTHVLYICTRKEYDAHKRIVGISQAEFLLISKQKVRDMITEVYHKAGQEYPGDEEIVKMMLAHEEVQKNPNNFFRDDEIGKCIRPVYCGHKEEKPVNLNIKKWKYRMLADFDFAVKCTGPLGHETVTEICELHKGRNNGFIPVEKFMQQRSVA